VLERLGAHLLHRPAQLFRFLQLLPVQIIQIEPSAACQHDEHNRDSFFDHVVLPVFVTCGCMINQFKRLRLELLRHNTRTEF
jgi:hypothetical protein